MKVKTALISVSDKTGLEKLGKALADKGIEIISTGGTAQALKEKGISVTPVSQYTGSPEIMEGRVKTVHPRVEGGILADRNKKKHLKDLKKIKGKPIDLVVVNFYPFEKTITGKKTGFQEAVENIDIGGPTMARAAAKNHESVAVVTDPRDYEQVIKELKNKGEITLKTREKLARKAFALTAYYDSIISAYLSSKAGEKFPEQLSLCFRKTADLRYGENPHQKAALYQEPLVEGPSLTQAEQIQGKQLSYNNILDLDSAVSLLREFEETGAVVVKHNNPCGASTSSDLLTAYQQALATDKMSAFGGIVALNREVREELAEELTSMFLEAIIAPYYSPQALETLSKKKRLRVMQLKGLEEKAGKAMDLQKIAGGLLYQEKDSALLKGDIKNLKVVTERKPGKEERKAMLFAWKVCKHVKSNCVVYALADRTIGIGAGQMSRVDSSVIGAMKAENAGLDTEGTALASDAFFPFRDGIDAAAEAGVTAIIQPGGSIRDQEVIDACDEHDIAMVFTGMRHFNH